MRSFDPWLLAGVLGFAVCSVAAAGRVFRIGLRRYESGNLVAMRG